MTLPISPSELVNITPCDFLAMRKRLFEHDVAKAQAERDAKHEREAAENRARLEAVETARLEALVEADRIRLEIEAAAARLLTAELVAQFHIVPVRGDVTTSAKAILKEVSEKHGFSVSVITGGRRHHAVVVARQEAMYRITVECPYLSYPAIGQRLGGRDHTTVRYGAIIHARRHRLPLPDRAGALQQ